jgi:hypothetical protein
LFLQFVAAVQAHLEPLAAAATGLASGGAAVAAVPRPPTTPQAIRIMPLVLKVMWTAIVRFFQRLLGSRS